MGAMPQEIALLLPDLEDRTNVSIARREYHSGKLFGHDAIVVFSRWGKVAAALTATTLINQFNVEFLIFTGVAGAADPLLNVGDIVIADTLIQHDFDASAMNIFKKFEIPLLGVSYFDVEEKLVAATILAATRYVATHSKETTIPKIIRGTIASGDQFIANPKQIERLISKISNLKCVEMEGAAMAQVAYEHSIPFVVVRAISDKADHSAPVDFVRFITDTASHYSHGIVTNLLRELK